MKDWKIIVALLSEVMIAKKTSLQQLSIDTGLSETHLCDVLKMLKEPTLQEFLTIAKNLKVNFYFEDQEDKTELNVLFEKAMTKLGRRPNSFSKN